jgi:hypothetical protein
LLTAVLFAGGCSSGVEDLVGRPEVEKADDATDNPPPAPPPPPPEEPGGDELDATRNEKEIPFDPPPVPPAATVPEPSAVLPAAKPQAAPLPEPSGGQPSIRLSAGVALAQTLPTGTAMGFSVDYEFTEGQPNPSSRYVWVIEPAKGQPVKFAGPLSRKSTLQVFVQQWRPENGPFQSHIEDLSGNKLSRSIPLR